LWILILIAASTPLVTLLFLFILPEENELGLKGMTKRAESFEVNRLDKDNQQNNDDSGQHSPAERSSLVPDRSIIAES